jgi:hypothetical protein
MAATCPVQSVTCFSAPGRTWALCTLAYRTGLARAAINTLLAVTSPPGKVTAGGLSAGSLPAGVGNTYF